MGHPNIDQLVRSAMQIMPVQNILGVLLTGRGEDGARSMAQLHKQGGYTIVESENSCLINDMPQAQIALGGVNEIVDRSFIAEKIETFVSQFSDL